MNEIRTILSVDGNNIIISTDNESGNASITKLLFEGNQFGMTEITKTNDGLALVIFGEWERAALFDAFNEHYEKLNNV